MSDFKLTRDRILGLIAVAAGVAIFISSFGIHSLLELNEPGPALFPRICAGGFIIFGAIMVVRKPKSEDKVFVTKAGWGRMAVLYVILMAYVFVGLEYVGYMISTPILLFALYMTLAEKENKPNPIKMALLALIVGGAMYIFFRHIIGVPLPRGVIIPAMGIKL